MVFVIQDRIINFIRLSKRLILMVNFVLNIDMRNFEPMNNLFSTYVLYSSTFFLN